MGLQRCPGDECPEFSSGRRGILAETIPGLLKVTASATCPDSGPKEARP